jgi:predicted nucleic acid-binding Zn ribbon protein
MGFRGPKPNPPASNANPLVRELDEYIGQRGRAASIAAGLSAPWWCQIRQGRQDPSLGNFQALANAAGYDLVLVRRP